MQEYASKINFDWTQPLDTLPSDHMERSKHAEFLTAFLVNKSKTGNYVLNLNAGWGAGKSYFLKRWIETIKDYYPTVYIDAWRDDHLKDPLLNVVAEIKSSLISKTEASVIDTTLLKGTWRLIKSVAPEATKAILKNKLGINIDELSEEIDGDGLADVGAKLVEGAIKAHEETINSIDNFKKAIVSWLHAVIDASRPQLNYPLFIFIDELDRCRPTFAIEMLETVKHIFDMENVVFVVATDKFQLEHSIKAVYGHDFNSRIYLDRFFNRTVVLNSFPPRNFIDSKIKKSQEIIKFFEDESNFLFQCKSTSRLEEMLNFLVNISNGFDMPLRSIDLWLDKLEAAVITAKKPFDIFLLSFLTALETQDASLLKSMANGVNVFNNNVVERVKFKDFIFPIHFSFNNCVGIIDSNAWSIQHLALNQLHINKMGFLSYVQYSLSAIKNIASKTLQEVEKNIIDEYRKTLTNEKLQGVSRLPNVNTEFYKACSDFITLHHLRNQLDLNNYFDICRMATYFD